MDICSLCYGHLQNSSDINIRYRLDLKNSLLPAKSKYNLLMLEAAHYFFFFGEQRILFTIWFHVFFLEGT